MTSHAKKTKAKRSHKLKANKANLKADMRRERKNLEILEALAAKDKA